VRGKQIVSDLTKTTNLVLGGTHVNQRLAICAHHHTIKIVIFASQAGDLQSFSAVAGGCRPSSRERTRLAVSSINCIDSANIQTQIHFYCAAVNNQ